MTALRVLSIAVASGRAGYVFLEAAKLLDWGVTIRAAKSATELAGFVQSLINDLKPDVVVTEKCDERCRKGKSARRMISAIAGIASHNYVLDVSVTRPRGFASKFDEACHLAKQHPEIVGYLPDHKRRAQDFEPRSMMIFEALAMARKVLLGPSTALAAAMG
jgi:hypothetical protein